jgi:glyoxylase-like metal-dependent hydrolase (beta-lactamase superfamily II)
MDLIARGIYAIDGLKMGRSYLVEDHDGLLLIDTSSPSASQGILDAIASIGRRPEDLRVIVATHYHYDHTGNVAALVERSGAQFCVHADDVPYVEGRSPWMAPKGPFGRLAARMAPRQVALKVERTLRDGDLLPYAGGLQVIHAPGHTPGHIALYAKDRRVLFTGDALMNSLGLRLPMSMSTHDMDQAKASIRKLAALDFDTALPGHGSPILSHASEKIGEWAAVWVG